MGTEWELSKENVQPLRKGRKVEILNETLQVKEESPSQSKLLDSQRRSMIEAIDAYEGDDPLHPWLQCIRWIKDAYPTGGYQSELLPVVEACTRTFQNDERYKSDIRYLRAWVLYADLCKEPREIYQFLELHCIGQDHALFYEAYATYMELCKKHSKANEIYELGLRRDAQPSTRLQNMYQSFLKRMMQRNERKLQEDQEDAFEPEKMRHFGDSRGPPTRAPMRPSFGHDQQRRKMHQPQVPRSTMDIFVDDEFHSGTRPSVVPEPVGVHVPAATWKNLGTQKEVRKENDQRPSKWNETTLPRLGKVSKHVEARPPIEVFVDEECEEAHARLKVKNASASSTTLRQRVDGVCDLRREQEALQKNPLMHFNDGEKPSTASLLPRDPSGNSREPDGPESGAPHLVGSEIFQGGEDGRETCFEEARLVRWKMPHPAAHHPAVSSPRSSAEKAKLIEKSLNMFQSKNAKQKNQDSRFSDREVPVPERRVHDIDISNKMVGKLSRGSSNESSSDESVASFLAPPATKSSMSRASSMSSIDEPPPFACSMPNSQFTANGEETIAIKKYAEELIIHGADPNGRRTDVGRHQGLIDQTINTKECLQDILSMFNRPLSCEKVPQRKPRASKSSRPSPNSTEGFDVFIDDDEDNPPVPRPQNNGVNLNRGFEIFNDEENDPSQLSKIHAKKGFEVFVDEVISAPPPRTRKLKMNSFEVFQDVPDVVKQPGKGSFEVFEDELPPTKPGKGSFEVFQDEPASTKAAKGNFLVDEVKHRVARPPARKIPSAMCEGSFDIFVDDDVVAKSSVPKQGSSSRGTESTFQVYADEDSIPAPKNVERRIPKSKPVSKSQTGGFSIFIDDDVAVQPVRKPKLQSSTRK